jgi:hypothetical protein
MQKKPWYQSKIILLSGSLLLVFGANLLGASLFRSGVTPEQIDAISDAYPQTVDIFNRIKAGENITNLIGLAFSTLILVARAWFTKTPAISAGK